jgi:hypothetical protein
MTKPPMMLTFLLSALTGCSELDNCPDAQDDVVIDTGVTFSEASIYESAPWDGPLAAYPAKTKLRFQHDLGTRPEVVLSYVSFTASGVGSDVTENTGNQGRIKCVDAREIVVVNDTCEEDFHIRVVAMASGEGSTDVTCHKE